MQQRRRISDVQGDSGEWRKVMEMAMWVVMKKNLMNRRSNSETFPRQSSSNLVLTFRPFRFTDALEFCLWGWNKNAVYRRKVHTRDDFLARIVDAAARINNRGFHIIRTADHLHTGDTIFIKVDRGIFEHSL